MTETVCCLLIIVIIIAVVFGYMTEMYTLIPIALLVALFIYVIIQNPASTKSDNKKPIINDKLSDGLIDS